MMPSAASTCTIKTMVSKMSTSIPRSVFLAYRRAADREEVLRDQRRAADQSAVHVGHGEQFLRVRGLAAASVEDRQPGRHLGIGPPDRSPDNHVHGLRLLGARGAPGADCPYRLVGNYSAAQRARAGNIEDRAELPPDHRLGRGLLALRERLADAEDRDEPRPLRGGELRRDLRIALAEELPPLRVPDDRVPAAELAQHRARHFAGIGPGVVLAERLRAQRDPRAGERARALLEIREGHAHSDDDLRRARRPELDRIEQPLVRGQAAVHLPVARDEPLAHPSPATKRWILSARWQTGQ